MGRRSREHRQAVIEGREAPFRPKRPQTATDKYIADFQERKFGKRGR